MAETLGIIATSARDARALGRPVPAPGEVVRVLPEILVVISGAGLPGARDGAEALLDAGAGALLSWGTGEGLLKKYRPGDVHLPRRVLSLSGEAWDVDLRWHARIRWLLPDGPGVHIGPLVTVAEPLTEPEAKQALSENLGAEGADRTSAGVAGAAETHGVPFLALRTVAEPVEFSWPGSVARSTGEDGRIRWIRALASCLARPGEIPGVIRMARQRRDAHRTLRAVARQGVLRLAPEGKERVHDSNTSDRER